MWIHRSNVHAQVTQATEAELSWLTDYLAYRNTRAHFSGGPERISLLHAFNRKFPAGFIELVEAAAKKEGIECLVRDTRKAPCSVDLAGLKAAEVFLRDYQLEAVETAIEKTNGILQAATGSGKSVVAVALVMSLPTEWLFLVNRTTLAVQMAEQYYARSKIRAGVIGEGAWDEGEGTLTCATFQSMYAALQANNPRALDILSRVGGVIVDESHTAPADTYQRVLNACGAYYRIGLSATPLARGDRKSILAIGTLGRVIHRVRATTLVDRKILARPEIVLVESSPVKPKADSWQRAEAECIVRSPTRNALLIEMAKRAEKPALLFVKCIEHGKKLTKSLGKEGLRAQFVWGEHCVAARQRAIKELLAGRLDVLVCSVVFDTGVDIPALRSVIVGSGGKSIIAALQRIGRGMRCAEGKSTFGVYDIADRHCGCMQAASELNDGGRVGLGAHPACKWLEKHARDRQRAYAKEGHNVRIERWVQP